MSSQPSPFRFVADAAGYREPGSLVVRVPARARGKEKLLGVLAAGLRFPRYFGWNWDALEECLSDLSWLGNVPRVTLVHEGLPFSPQGAQLAIYLGLLAECVRRRLPPAAPPQLDVIWPQELAAAVQALIRGGDE